LEKLIGKRFGNFKVLSYEGFIKKKGNSKKKHYFKCLCDCGKEFSRTKHSITSKASFKSCGCLTIVKLLERSTKHNLSDTRFHNIWQKIRVRVKNSNNPNYKHYGGRGIKLCESWNENFVNFKDDMYESYLKHVEIHGEKNTSLDRIDVNGNYEPENCRWATQKEQTRNRVTTKKVKVLDFKTNEFLLSANSPAEAAELLGINGSSHIYAVLKGKRPHTRGYKFIYEEGAERHEI
jgi:hypothetical protein